MTEDGPAIQLCKAAGAVCQWLVLICQLVKHYGLLLMSW